MFKFVLVCALIAVATSSPIPNEVRKTANIQKTSEYYLTAESKPPAPRTTGLTRPSPINPNIQSDPKPEESGKIIPASLTYGEPKSAAQPDAESADKPKVQTSVTSSSTPARTITERHVAESTNIESAKVPAPVSSEHQSNNPTVLRTTQITSYPAAHLDSNPSIASPISSGKSSQPTIVGVEKKVVKRENSPSKHVEHDNTSDADTNDSDDTSSHHKHNEKQSSKPLSSNNDESSYDRDNQPPKYVHPVPVSQIVKNSPPAEIHHHKEEEE